MEPNILTMGQIPFRPELVIACPMKRQPQTFPKTKKRKRDEIVILATKSCRGTDLKWSKWRIKRFLEKHRPEPQLVEVYNEHLLTDKATLHIRGES